MEQLLCHLFGDYILQSDWMAQNKRSNSLAAFLHAWAYSSCFVFLTWNRPLPYIVILVTHFFIDRFGLARYLVWAKNWMGVKQIWMMIEPDPETPSYGFLYEGYLPNKGHWFGKQATPPWRFCEKTGNPPGRPEYLAVWLTIIADNTLHLLINYCALRWL